MRVFLSPQVSDMKIEYTFENEVITANYNGEVDEFDFSGMPDGEMGEIETTLPVNPILSASKINGILSVELLNYIGEDATYEDRFPQWIEV